MAKNFNWWSRKLHRWGALVTALPMLLVIVSGLLLQVKKEFSWIQPATQSGTAKGELPQKDWQAMVNAASTDPQAGIQTWTDIARMDVQPSKGIAKLLSDTDWELQIDLATGEVLSSAQRRSDLIERLHDGSFFADFAKLWIFLPNGLVLLGLWLTGAWLWYLPMRARKRKRPAATSSTD